MQTDLFDNEAYFLDAGSYQNSLKQDTSAASVGSIAPMQDGFSFCGKTTKKPALKKQNFPFNTTAPGRDFHPAGPGRTGENERNKMNIQEILNDPCASYWLKDAINTALKRDPVDALNDAEMLAEALRKRLDEIIEDEVRSLHSLPYARLAQTSTLTKEIK